MHVDITSVFFSSFSQRKKEEREGESSSSFGPLPPPFFFSFRCFFSPPAPAQEMIGWHCLFVFVSFFSIFFSCSSEKFAPFAPESRFGDVQSKHGHMRERKAEKEI